MPKLTINYLEHYWNPKAVPTQEEYEVLRSLSDAEFKMFLQQRKEELRKSFDQRNPYSWKIVGLLAVLTAVMFALCNPGDTTWKRSVADILFFITMCAFLATGWSKNYVKAFYSQRKFYNFSREAAKSYDYPTFVRFTETKLLKMDYTQSW